MSPTTRTRGLSHLLRVAALVACAASATQAQNETAIATQILGTTGVRPGILVHVGCGSGVLTAELGSRYGTVHGITDVAGQADAARACILSRGLYGPVSAVRCALSRLPYEDDLITVLVVDSLPALVARGLSVAEIVRVLSPQGMAYLGGGNESALRSLLDGAGLSGYQIVNQNGVWASYVKPYPADMDEWRQFRHDGSLAAVSSDKRVGPPSGIRWMAGDRWIPEGLSWGLDGLYSSNGRTYYLYTYEPVVDADHLLVVRNAYNGVLLWTKPIRFGGTGGGRQPFVAWGDRVYTKLASGQPVVALDAATGEVVQTYTFTADMLTMVNDTMLIVGAGRHAAYDVRTGARIWQTADSASGYAPCAVGEGKMFLKAYEGGVNGDILCISLADGGVLWSAPNSDYGFQFTPLYRNGILFTKHGEQTVDAGNCAYSAADGTLLWSRQYPVHSHQGRPDPFFLGGRVWIQDNGPPQAWLGLNPQTGIEEQRLPTLLQRDYLRCYSNVATESCILEGIGIGFLDFTRGAYQEFYGGRGMCGDGGGYRPANGLVYKAADVCVCFASVRGEVAYSGGAMLDPAALRAAAPPSLEQGPAFGAGSGAAAADDWPTFRHDPSRSGSTTLALPAVLSVHWSAAVGSSTSSPVVADDRLFAAAPDQHQVKAFDAASGAALWSYTAGGRVDSPPTYYQGYVLFGCADGWVYSVRASDGVLAWRFRAAPQERRIAVRGQLEDAWPLHGAVLVQGGVAYVAAGRQSEVQGGIQVFALNPLTGAVAWQKQVIRQDLCLEQDRTQIRNTTNSILSSDGQSLYMDRAILDLATGAERETATGYFLYGGTGGFEDDIAHPPFDWKHNWRRWDYSNVAVGHGGHLYPDYVSGYGISVSSAAVVRFNLSAVSDITASTATGAQLWTDSVASGPLMKAVMVAGDKVYVAVHTEPASSSAGEVWVHSLADGGALDTFALGAAPRFDGLAAAGNRLYVATQDGRVLCLAEGTVSVAVGAAQSAPSQRLSVPATPPARAFAWRIASPAVAGTHVNAATHAAADRSPQVCRSLLDMRWHSDLPSLGVAEVRSSSSAGVNKAAHTLDRDLATRWAPADTGPQWACYDLGSTREISSMSIVWHGVKQTSAAFTIEVSTDAAVYEVVDAGRLEGRGTKATLRAFVPINCRYVRLRLWSQADVACPSVYEVGIHEGGAHQQALVE